MAIQNETLVRPPQGLFRTVGDGALRVPHDDVLTGGEIQVVPVRHSAWGQFGHRDLIERYGLIGRHCRARRWRVRVVPDVQSLVVVDGHPVLESADLEQIGEYQRMAQLPVYVLFCLTLQYAPFDNAMLEFIEPYELVLGDMTGLLRLPGLFPNVVGEMAVEPLGVDRVHRVLHYLQIVAWQDRHADIPVDVVPNQQVPTGQQGNWQRPQIGEYQAAQFLHRVSGGGYFVFEGLERVLFSFIGLIQATAFVVEEPAMIRAAQSVIVGHAVDQVYFSVWALVADESIPALPVFVQDQILSQKPNGPRGVVVHLRSSCDWLPIPPHQIPHGSAWTYSCQAFVFLFR